MAAILVCAATIALVPRPADAATHTLRGTVVVRGGVSLEECAGADDQSDIHEGSRVRLRDREDHVIARARLGVGEAGGGGVDRCLFRFTMRNVPSSPVYSFLVADRPAGRAVTRDRLARHDWRVTLTPS